MTFMEWITQFFGSQGLPPVHVLDSYRQAYYAGRESLRSEMLDLLRNAAERSEERH